MHYDSTGLEQAPLRNSVLSIAIATALFSVAAPSYAGITTVRGVVAGSLFTPPVNSNNPAQAAPSNTIASVYSGAKVCFDLNNDGICESNEPTTTSASNGSFALSTLTPANLIAEISTSTTMGNIQMSHRNVLRLSSAQIAASATSPFLPVNVAITPLSTEALRMIESDGLSFAAAKGALAQRLGVDPTVVLADPNTISNAAQQTAVLNESVILTNRFTLAAKMVDRGAVAQIPAAQQAAMNLEGIPRYDHIFIVMLENKATNSIVNSPYAPNINHFLQSGNQFTNYYATGNPSEPNYTALGGADDFGITDDNQWNCHATGANAPLDLPLPTKTQPGLGSSPFTDPGCTDSGVVNHNILSHPNLFNALSSAGMTWRTYNESTNPGQDFRTDSVADSAVVAPDHVYAAGTLNGNASAVGDPNLNLPMAAGLYKTKHNPAMAYQNVRSAPEFKASNRTLGGGQWDAVLGNSSAYAIPVGYDKDQFGTDLANGNIGVLNYVIPDQCDDMHSITVSGTSGGVARTASDCGGVSNGNAPAPNDSHDNIIARGDNYVQFLVNKIQTSPVWNNSQKRVAIVLMFDEGSATNGPSNPFNSCCGWNPGNSTVAKSLIQNADGTFSTDPSIAGYSGGNRGHGNSIFAVLTNQANAPKGIKDSDAYSHFSFVRTLQDMFGVADPGVAGSYMNRSKYTESFVSANILNLPEYQSSADTHFDSVRPMNHAFVIPASYVEKQSTDESVIAAGSGNPAGTVPAQIGADANQINVWALKQ